MRLLSCVLLTCFCTIFSVISIFAQQANTSRIGIRFSTLHNQKHTITPGYSVEEFASKASYTPEVSTGFEGSVFYKQVIDERWNISFGLIGGVYAKQQKFFFSEEFTGVERRFEEDRIKDFEAGYGGLSLLAEYAFLRFSQSRLEVRGGVSYLLFLQQSIRSGYSISAGGQSSISVFESNLNISPNNVGFLTPELGLAYTYTFWERLSLSAVAGVRYSNSLISNGDYTVIGDGERIFGQFEQSLLSFNPGIEIAYNFK